MGGGGGGGGGAGGKVCAEIRIELLVGPGRKIWIPVNSVDLILCRPRTQRVANPPLKINMAMCQSE